MTDETFPTLEAVGTGRRVGADSLDRPVVFLCYAEATQNEAPPVEAAVRERYPASRVLVAHVIDLHTVPGMFRGMAQNILNAEYEKAVAELPAGETAEDYVVILPDWDGAFVNALGLQDVSKQLGVAVFATGGRLLGLAQAADIPAEALALLDGA